MRRSLLFLVTTALAVGSLQPLLAQPGDGPPRRPDSRDDDDRRDEGGRGSRDRSERDRSDRDERPSRPGDRHRSWSRGDRDEHPGRPGDRHQSGSRGPRGDDRPSFGWGRGFSRDRSEGDRDSRFSEFRFRPPFHSGRGPSFAGPFGRGGFGQDSFGPRFGMTHRGDFERSREGGDRGPQRGGPQRFAFRSPGDRPSGPEHRFHHGQGWGGPRDGSDRRRSDGDRGPRSEGERHRNFAGQTWGRHHDGPHAGPRHHSDRSGSHREGSAHERFRREFSHSDRGDFRGRHQFHFSSNSGSGPGSRGGAPWSHRGPSFSGSGFGGFSGFGSGRPGGSFARMGEGRRDSDDSRSESRPPRHRGEGAGERFRGEERSPGRPESGRPGPDGRGPGRRPEPRDESPRGGERASRPAEDDLRADRMLLTEALRLAQWLDVHPVK